MAKNKFHLKSYWDRLEQASAWEASEDHPTVVEKYQCGPDVLYVYENSSTVYVVCTGSNHILEWVTNLAIIPWRGFHLAYYNKARRFLKKIDWSGRTGKRMRFICHSRGIYGAILANMVKGKYNTNDIEVISFGAPEFMTERGNRKFNVRHVRVDMERDIVTGIMPSPFKYFEDELHILPTVRGAFDHVAYGKALGA